MIVRASGLSLALLVALAGSVRSQQPIPPDSLAATTLDPLVTTATRDQRSLTDVPAAVSVADTIAIRA
jgi:outer membrane cobalamin receptor